MRHSTGDLTDRFHFLRLGELFARLAQFLAGVAEDSLSAFALRRIARQNEAGRCCTDQKDDEKRRYAPNQRPSQNYPADPESYKNESRSGAHARTTTQSRP